MSEREKSSQASAVASSSRGRTRSRTRVLPLTGEVRPVILAVGYHFCLLFSYYLLRPMRDALGIDGGLDKLPWLWTGTTIAMLVASPLFAWLVSRTPRRTFIPLSYHAFAAVFMVFALLLGVLEGEARLGVGYAFYIWMSVFNLFAVSIFWGFMTDMFRREQAARLFGIIAVGGTLGAIGGSAFTKDFAGALSPWMLVVTAVVILELAVLFAWLLVRHFRLTSGASEASGAVPWSESAAEQRGTRGTGASASTGNEPASTLPARGEPGPDPIRGFALIARSPYLMCMALYMLLYSLTSTFLYFEQSRIAHDSFPDRAQRTQFNATVDLATNVLTLGTQLLLTASIIRWIGVSGTLLVLPVITLLGFVGFQAGLAGEATTLGGLLSAPVSGSAAVLLIFTVARRGMHFAVDRPAREILYTPLGPDEKYKSKNFIDTFVYRAGDLLGAWTESLLKGASAALTPILVAIPVAAAWIGVALTLGLLHRRVVRDKTREPGA